MTGLHFHHPSGDYLYQKDKEKKNMEDRNERNIASRAAAIVFGILAGFGGLIHGIGEVLQGNASTPGLWIESWAQGPIFENMGGEPGISILPTFLWAGILTIIASVAVIVWSAAFVGKKKGGWILLFLSIFMLLMGGGIGPPVIGILAGVAGIGIHPREGRGLSSSFLSALWPWVFGVTVIVVAFIAVGSLALAYLVDFNHPYLFSNGFLASVILLILVNIAGRAYDTRRRQNG
jgi:hypothetical protein